MMRYQDTSVNQGELLMLGTSRLLQVTVTLYRQIDWI
jgi:hypothetical protein